MTGNPSSEPTVADLGERALIRLLSRYMAPVGPDVLVSIGDDCAVLSPPAEPVREILTTDMLVEGTHFLRNGETDWYALGRKAAAANLSDIASMGARPVSLLVSLGLPGDLPVAHLEALYRGLADETAHSGGSLVGGDSTRSPILVINVAVTGESSVANALPLRSSCLAGQDLYLSGSLGGSLAGLRLITDPAFARFRSHPAAAELIRRHWMPEPRVVLGQALAAACPDLAMIDISDGLYNELHLLSEASGVRIELELDAVPLWPGVMEFARATATSADQYRLFSGEEYELLFATALPEELLRDQLGGILPPVTRIGRVVPGAGVAFLREGCEVLPADQTFAHFRKRETDTDSPE